MNYTKTESKMNRIFAIILFTGTIAGSALANNFDSILQNIEQKNAYLSAQRLEADAEKANARADASLSGIEAEFNYSFGLENIPNKYDWSVNQTFDGASITGQKNKLSKEIQKTSNLRYLTKLQQIKVTARKLCIEVVYCNAMLKHLKHDLEDTHKMNEEYEKLFNNGEITIIDRNKAHHEMIIYEDRFREVTTTKANALAMLTHMNGGESVVIEDSAFIHEQLPEDFTLWLNENIERHPELKLIVGETATNQQALKVAKAEYVPGITIGYIGEVDGDFKYHGIALGISLPSWGAGKNVKTKKLQAKAAEIMIEDNKKQLRVQLENIYREALQYQEAYKTHQKHVYECDVTPHLNQMLEQGTLTPLDFHIERQYFHAMIEYMLDAEKEYEMKLAELSF